MFLKLSKTRIVNITNATILRGSKGEVIVDNGSAPVTTNLSFDDMLDHLYRNKQLLDLQLVQFIPDDTDETQQAEDEEIFGKSYSSSSNLEEDGSNQTEEELMKTERQKAVDARILHEHQSRNDALASASKVHEVLRRLYNPISLSGDVVLSTIDGYDNDEFIGAMDEATEFTFDAESIEESFTVDQVVNLVERKQIEVNTAKVQAETEEEEEPVVEPTEPEPEPEPEPEEPVVEEPTEPEPETPVDDEEEESPTTVTVEEIVASIQAELGIEEDVSDIDPNKNVGEWIDGTETTLEDIIDRIANDFEVEIDESEVFTTTTVTQLADLVNAKKIAV